MGGRGSSLAYKHMNAEDDGPIRITNWNDPESLLQNEMFKKLKENKVSTRESTDSIDDKTFERQQQQVLDVVKKYNKALANTTRKEDIQLGGEVLTGNTLGYCSTVVENGELRQRIVLDKRQFKNYDKIAKTVTRGVQNKHFVPINTMFKSRDYIVTHELGHAVENGIMVKLAEENHIKKEAFFEHKNDLAAKIKNEVIKIYQKEFAKDNNFDKIFLSKYSRKNDREWFAETFTNLQLADKPEPIAQALQKYLRRYEQ